MASKKYLTSKDVCEIFDISKRTLQRWEEKSPFGKPFPAPAFPTTAGVVKRYLTEQVSEWETECLQAEA